MYGTCKVLCMQHYHCWLVTCSLFVFVFYCSTFCFKPLYMYMWITEKLELTFSLSSLLFSSPCHLFQIWRPCNWWGKMYVHVYDHYQLDSFRNNSVVCVCACVCCVHACVCLFSIELSQLSRLSSSVAPTQCCGWIPYTHVYMYSTCIYCTCVLSVVLTLALVAVVVRRLPFAVWLELSSPVSSAKRIPAL